MLKKEESYSTNLSIVKKIRRLEKHFQSLSSKTKCMFFLKKVESKNFTLFYFNNSLIFILIYKRLLTFKYIEFPGTIIIMEP